MTTDRRSFLKLAMRCPPPPRAWPPPRSTSGPGREVAPEDPRERMGAGVRWDKAPCRFCGTGCHVQVGVKDGRVVAIAGDVQAEVNRGLLCVKGYHVGLALYGRTASRTPMLRKGDDRCPISWEEAIGIIADRVISSTQRASPSTAAASGPSPKDTQPTEAHEGRSVQQPHRPQRAPVYGLGGDRVPLGARRRRARGLLRRSRRGRRGHLVGQQPRRDAPGAVLAHHRPRARGSRSPSSTSAPAARARPPTPSTSWSSSPHRSRHRQRHRPPAARRGTWDKDFVESTARSAATARSPPALIGAAITFEEFSRELAKFTPEYVEQLSGVPAATSGCSAGCSGGSRPAHHQPVVYGHEPAHPRHGDQLARARHSPAQRALRASPGRRPDQPHRAALACGTCARWARCPTPCPAACVVAKDEHAQMPRSSGTCPPAASTPSPVSHRADVPKRSTAGKGGDIHTIWVQVTNPGQTLPNRRKLFTPAWRRPDKFLIVSDVYPTATTRSADLILPIGDVGREERHVRQLRAPHPAVVQDGEPARQARDDAWQTSPWPQAARAATRA
jgi:nitrate reductase NapA